MNIKEFFKRCEEHDWFFQMSDDHRVWLSGTQDQEEIEKFTKKNKLFNKIWNDWVNYVYSGGNFSDYPKEKLPKPLLENYIQGDRGR